MLKGTSVKYCLDGSRGLTVLYFFEIQHCQFDFLSTNTVQLFLHLVATFSYTISCIKHLNYFNVFFKHGSNSLNQVHDMFDFYEYNGVWQMRNICFDQYGTF